MEVDATEEGGWSIGCCGSSGGVYGYIASDGLVGDVEPSFSANFSNIDGPDENTGCCCFTECDIFNGDSTFSSGSAGSST